MHMALEHLQACLLKQILNVNTFVWRIKKKPKILHKEITWVMQVHLQLNLVVRELVQ